MFQLTTDNIYIPSAALEVHYIDKVSGGNSAPGKTLCNDMTCERVLKQTKP